MKGIILLCGTITPSPPPVFNTTSVSTFVETEKDAFTTGLVTLIVVPLTGTPKGNTLLVTI